jgi:hypothetical protein
MIRDCKPLLGHAVACSDLKGQGEPVETLRKYKQAVKKNFGFALELGLKAILLTSRFFKNISRKIYFSFM